MFAFSCGTGVNRAELKTKLFEAYFRAQQLGGDEARAALVCLYDDPISVEDEAQNLIDMDAMSKAGSEPGGRKSRDPREKVVRVFGRPDLKDLGKNLAEWINYQSGAKQ